MSLTKVRMAATCLLHAVQNLLIIVVRDHDHFTRRYEGALHVDMLGLVKFQLLHLIHKLRTSILIIKHAVKSLILAISFNQFNSIYSLEENIEKHNRFSAFIDKIFMKLHKKN